MSEKRRRTARRGNGEGSIFRRKDRNGKPGLWAATISVGYDERGKRKRMTIYGQTKGEVQEKLTKLQSKKIDGTLTEPSRMTVGQFLDHWMESDARQRIRETTFVGYSDLIRIHIKPNIGGMRLTKLSVVNIQQLYSAMERDGRSARQRQYVHAVLRRALSRAKFWGMIAVNPCELVERPSVAKKEMKFLDADQSQAFLKAAESDRLYALYVLALSTGLRQGELFGLRWDDIDLDGGRLTVVRSLVEIRGKHSFGEPKSRKGRRSLHVSPKAISALHDHRRRMMIEGNAGSPVIFCSREGGLLRKGNVIRRSFRSIIKRANAAAKKEAMSRGSQPALLPAIRFHDLRHSHATALLRAGVHPKTMQERLGHATIGQTLDTYSHSVPSLDRGAADLIDSILFTPPEEDDSQKITAV